MKDQGLVVIFEIGVDFLQKKIGKIAVFREISAIFEVNNLNFRSNSGVFSFFAETNQRRMILGEIVIRNQGCSGAEKTIDLAGLSDEAGEAKGGIFGVLLLKIARFVSFVDDNESKIAKRQEKGGAGADDDLRRIGLQEFFPDEMAFGFGLARMK